MVAILKICEYCRKEYKTYKSKSKFCSMECSAKNQNRMIEKVCEKCGKAFKIHAYRKDTARFCSNKCNEESQGYGVRKIVKCIFVGKALKFILI